GAKLWPAVVDQIKAQPGYERALGAALGDDLDASTDTGAPIHWTTIAADDDPALPAGATPLSQFVSGSDLLRRRLDQTGLVDAADGARLAQALEAGQLLVTRDGALWRWDGLVAAADAPSAAAERLARRNRLAELDAEIAAKRRERSDQKAAIDALAAVLETARQADRAKREAWRQAQHAIGAAQGEVDRAQKAIGELISRRSALEEARVRLESSLTEAEAVGADAERALAEAGDEAAAGREAGAAEARLRALREAAEQARLRLATFETAGRMRAGRLAQIAGE